MKLSADCRMLLGALLLCLGWSASHAEDELQIETVATGLENPWSLTFLPDGRMLVTERAGRLRIIEDGELLPDPVANVPPAYVAMQAGLFEVLAAPDFDETQQLYLSLASGTARSNTIRVIRARLVDHRLEDVETIFQSEPSRDTPVHYGGRLLFLPDGSLLLGTGDGFDYREMAQQRSNHIGSILRFHTDGSVPSDNPFLQESDTAPELFTYGHRNVQGLALDPETGTIWQHEHGPRGGDELNRLQAGANYGWPIVAHAVNYSGAHVTPFTELPGVENPVHIWNSAIAPAGLAVYRAEAFPDWQGNLLVAGLASRAVHRLVIEDDHVVTEQQLFTELDRRFRDVRVGPDGYVYLLTDHGDGEVLRVLPRP